MTPMEYIIGGIGIGLSVAVFFFALYKILTDVEHSCKHEFENAEKGMA